MRRTRVDDGLEYRILGPVEVWSGNQEIVVGGRKARTLLAVLLLHANDLVSADQLADDLWDDAPPASARATLRTHVSHLRSRLSGGSDEGAGSPLFTRGSGYGLRVDADRLDADRFRRLVDRGTSLLGNGDPASAAATLRDALGLWRGPVLGELNGAHFAMAEAARLDEHRLSAIDTMLRAELASGRHATIVGELEQLVAQHPLRETLTGHLMVALYRCGRQADALAAYAATRRHLLDELGLEPSPALRNLELAVLRQDPTLDAPAPVSARSAETHRSAPALLDLNQLGPLFERDAAVGQLLEWFGEAARGDRRVALVSGEAGVGKTRLAAAVAGAAYERGALVLAGQCDRVPLAAYQPVAEALRSHGQSPGDVLDLVGPIVGTDAGDLSASDERDRFRLFETVDELLGRLASAAPVVLVLDDLQWADESTLLLFHHLVRSTRPGSVLIVGLFRSSSDDAVLAGTLADLRRSRRGVHVALTALGSDGIAALVEDRVGIAPPAGFVRTLVQLTAGNPFYAGEIVAHLQEQKAVGQLLPWPTAAAIAALGTPLGVKEVIRGRLAGLGDDIVAVLRAAAVLGRDSEFVALARLVGSDEESVLGAVEESMRLGLLVETGASWSAEYSFRHELLRQTVYDEISIARRQRLHLRAADLFESTAGLPSSAARVATHLRAAGAAVDPARVVTACLAAADAAERVYAWDEAARHLDGALDAEARQGAAPRTLAELAERAGTLISLSNIDHRAAVAHFEAALRGYDEARDEEAAARVHSRLGLALSTHPTVIDIPRAIDHYERAAPVLARDPHSLRACHLHLGRGAAAIFALRTDEIAAAAAAAAAIAERHDHRQLGSWAAYQLAWAEFNRGRLAACDEWHRRVWDGGLEVDDPHLAWMAAFGASLHRTMYLGDPMTAAEWCRRALAQPGLEHLPRQRVSLLDQLAVARGLGGDIDAAQSLAEELGPDAVVHRMLAIWRGEWVHAARSWAAALDRDVAAGDHLDAVVSAYWLGHVLRRAGRPDEAVDTIARGLAIAVGGPQIPSELGLRAEAARLAAAGGRLDDAAVHLARGHEILASGERWAGLAGQVHAAEAALWAAHGDQGRAEASRTMAMDTFRRLSLPWMEADVADS